MYSSLHELCCLFQQCPRHASQRDPADEGPDSPQLEGGSFPVAVTLPCCLRYRRTGSRWHIPLPSCTAKTICDPSMCGTVSFIRCG
ncbi:hypothetical protein NDU88_005444 [Pleurodeles waltl]|uniref:Uncharacterized protein n=1 Tax=Pleurodeles waltl TaxID=8319 RepID=A0AAV7MAI5_PLEWA|nr:hypothetical protein NDU88_005444 [Pleurodeles waltl]